MQFVKTSHCSLRSSHKLESRRQITTSINALNIQILKEPPILLANWRNIDQPFKNLSFYKYAQIDDSFLLQIRDKFWSEWTELGVSGRIIVGSEGINGQVTVPDSRMQAFTRTLESIPQFQKISEKFNFATDQLNKAFNTLRIRVKNEIVKSNVLEDQYLEDIEAIDQNREVSQSKDDSHLPPTEFHNSLKDPNAIVVDVRNCYESEIGHFENAIKPDVVTFGESLPIIHDILKGKEEDKIYLYCTGGIRCEKTTVFLKQHGFKNIFQLKGGIINYANAVKQGQIKDSLFKGKNFCFDERMGERVTNDILTVCHQCGTSCDTHVNCANQACSHLFIQCPNCSSKYKSTCSEECKEVVELPAEQYKQYLKERSAPRGNSARYRGKLPFSVQQRNKNQHS